MRKFTAQKISLIFNFLELMFVILILFMASAFQFYLHELPCPLCLLQRIGFMLMAYGFLLNFRFKPKPMHYSIIILSGIFTAFVALRQIALHIEPGTGAYGDAIFGLHLYTWSFIIAICIVIATTLVLAPNTQYFLHYQIPSWIINFVFMAVIMIIALNLVSVILECGFSTCPDNPTQYKLLDFTQLQQSSRLFTHITTNKFLTM